MVSFFVNTVDTKIKASNAFHVMLVNVVDTGVCGSDTTPYAGVKTLHKVASHPCQGKATVLCEPSVLGVWLFTSQSEEAALLTFLDLSRHTANPKFLKLKGAQQPNNSYKSMTKLHPPYPN